MNTHHTIPTLDAQLGAMIKAWTRLLKDLKTDIGDEFRASDNPADTMPGMQVTIGLTVNDDGTVSWSYQTGDNSYTGGAYGHPHWAVVSLYRRSNSRELAEDCASQIADLVCQ